MKAYNLQAALQNPDQTATLFVHNCNLTEIPEEIFRLKNLKSLTLSDNKIKNLPSRFHELYSLEELNLNNNLFETIPDVITELKNLKKLKLTGNQLREIPSFISKLNFLEELEVSNNLLKTIPQELFDLNELKILDLSNNELSKISKSIGKCRSLERLNLSKNGINNLPDELSNCNELRFLNLNENKLKTLPSNFSNLTKLEKLSIGQNKIQILPDDLGNLIWLRELDLSQNKLQVLPTSIGSLNWLFRLNLRKNKLDNLPDSIGQLSRLQSLNLEYNCLTIFPSTLIKIGGIQQLFVKGNKIETEKHFLFNFKKLKSFSGLTVVFNAKEKRQFLNFLKQCRKAKIPETIALDFYQLLFSNKKSSKPILIEALNFPNKKIREKALDQIFENHNPSKPFTENSVFATLGKTNLNKKEIATKAQKIDISYKSKVDETVSHIVLGTSPKQVAFLKKFKGTFLKEVDFLQFIKENTKEEKGAFSAKAIDNLRRFLLSEKEEHVNIGIQILKTNGVPPEIITDLFIAYKSSKNTRQRKEMRILLTLNGSEKLRKHLSLRLGLGGNVKKEIRRKNIEIYAEGTELESEKLIQYFIK